MSHDAQKQIHSQLRTMQDKYTYFLLAVAASAIALSVQITKNATFSLDLIPLGLAVLAWAGSFYTGCIYIQYVQSNLVANSRYLKIQSGTDNEVGSNPMLIRAASEGVMDAMEKNSDRATSLSAWQFKLLILGGIFYIVWYILEMFMRTVGQN